MHKSPSLRLPLVKIFIILSRLVLHRFPNLTYRLHLRGEGGAGSRELLEIEAGDLGYHVVDGGFERGGGLLGDVVSDHVQSVANSEQRRHLRNGEASRLFHK